MTTTPTSSSHAEITAPISADLRRIEQSAARAADRDTHFYLAGWNGARENEDSHEHFRRALQAATPAPAAVPVLYVSPAQLEKHLDLEGAENAKAGRYLPARKTPAGNFTQPLYTLTAAPASASDSESVLIDGIAYEVPAAVAGELLSLHLDLLAAAPAQAVAVPQVITDAMILAAWSAAAPERAGDITPFHAAEMKAILSAGIGAAPAQEHATQLEGQAVSMSHREWRFALQEAIETMDAEIDSRGDESNVRRMKRAKAVLSTMLAAPAQAQEDARDLEAEALRACRDLPEGWEIVIHLEKGYGGVVLIDPEDNENDLPVDGMLLDALKESIDQAVQADAARAAQGGA